MQVESARVLDSEMLKAIEHRTVKFTEKLGGSDLAKRKAEEYRERSTALTREIFEKFGEYIEAIDAYAKTGLHSRAVSIINHVIQNTDNSKLAKAGMIFPKACFQIARDPQMPEKDLSEQSAKELARTVTLTYSYMIDGGLDMAMEINPPGRVVELLFNKIRPAIKRRIYKGSEKKFRAEWIREDLLTHARFMTSPSGRKMVDGALEIEFMNQKEMKKAEEEFIREKKEQDRANGRENPFTSLLSSLNSINFN